MCSQVYAYGGHRYGLEVPRDIDVGRIKATVVADVVESG